MAWSSMVRGLFVPGSDEPSAPGTFGRIDRWPSGAYNFQLQRHHGGPELLRYPDRLWSPSPYWSRHSGLHAHLLELGRRTGGVVYSDVLVVLHPEDLGKTRQSMLRSWEEAARAELADCFERFVQNRGYRVALPERPLQLRVIGDGDPMLGATVGLRPGEFATALLPNLYLGPISSSHPLLEIFLRGPDGFESAGTLYTDQLAFTIGAHPLDNASRPDLGDSCLYTVHRIPGEAGVRHKVGADWTSRLRVDAGQAHGGETIKVVDPARDKTVLEVMLVAAKELGAELPWPDERPSPDLPGLPGFLPRPAGITILPDAFDLTQAGALSIIPEALPERVHTLSERSFLLQKVHFRKEMLGYRLDVGRDGEVAPELPQPVARLEVLGDKVAVLAVDRDVVLDGEPMRAGEARPLTAEHGISWVGGSIRYEALRRNDIKRWPYLGRVRQPGRSTPLPEGRRYSIGRDRDACDVALPDRPTCGNVLWHDGRTSGPIAVRGGEVDRGAFRTDAVLVATRAAELDLEGLEPRLRNLSSTCPLHVLRADGAAVRVKRDGELDLMPGDELLIGNHAFRLLGPGENEGSVEGSVEVPVEAPPPTSERLAGGPGLRGRRPRAGGRAGTLVQPDRTYRALLGLDGPREAPAAAARAALEAEPLPAEPAVIQPAAPGLELLPNLAALPTAQGDDGPIVVVQMVPEETGDDLFSAGFGAWLAPAPTVQDEPDDLFDADLGSFLPEAPTVHFDERPASVPE
jgi:hypothetical protein